MFTKRPTCIKTNDKADDSFLQVLLTSLNCPNKDQQSESLTIHRTHSTAILKLSLRIKVHGLKVFFFVKMAHFTFKWVIEC